MARGLEDVECAEGIHLEILPRICHRCGHRYLPGEMEHDIRLRHRLQQGAVFIPDISADDIHAAAVPRPQPSEILI